jgi:hypothetical protein
MMMNPIELVFTSRFTLLLLEGMTGSVLSLQTSIGGIAMMVVCMELLLRRFLFT